MSDQTRPSHDLPALSEGLEQIIGRLEHVRTNHPSDDATVNFFLCEAIMRLAQGNKALRKAAVKEAVGGAVKSETP